MARAGRRTRIARNVYRDASGIAGVVRVGAQTEELRFPHGTPTPTIWRAIDARRDELQGQAARPPAPDDPLATTVAAYLATLPTVARRTDRAALLQPWIDALGDQPFPDVPRLALLAAIDAWVKAGLSPSRVNKRISALRVCWRRMAPDHAAAHPIMAITRHTDRPALEKSLPIALVTRILDAVPDTWTKSRIRLRVLAWTGQPAERIRAIQPGHIRWDATPPQLYVSPRRKGTGSADGWLPLLPQAVTALRDLFEAGANGYFTSSPLGRILRVGVETVQAELRAAGDHATAARLDDVTPYWLRHSFLTALAEQTEDIYAVAEYAGHSNLQTTRRYMKGASARRMAQGIAALERALPEVDAG